MRDQLIADLVEITRGLNSYSDVPPSVKQKAKELGKKLEAGGGKDWMQDAYYEVHSRNQAAANVLRYYWSGIGEWRV